MTTPAKVALVGAGYVGAVLLAWGGVAIYVAVAVTGVSAVIVLFAAQAAGASRTVQYWSMYAILRTLVAPLFALAFLVGGVMSPHRRARIALGAATLSEAAVFVCTVGLWILQTRH